MNSGTRILQLQVERSFTEYANNATRHTRRGRHCAAMFAGGL